MPGFNDVAWFEIGTDDPAGAEKFYGEVFGWTVSEDVVTRGYGIVTTPGGGQGGIFARPAGTPGYAIFAVAVESVEDTLRRVVEAGGSVAGGPLTTQDGLVFGYLNDPAGHRVGVFTPPGQG